MGYKLAIDDKVGVKVEGKYVGESGVERSYRFVLVCDRLTNDELLEAQRSDEMASDFILRVSRDWRDQRLVLDEDGKPAAFSQEALGRLLCIANMPIVCWNAYRMQVQATGKN